jgi:hypothetical protein
MDFRRSQRETPILVNMLQTNIKGIVLFPAMSKSLYINILIRVR